jgi:hypothetical protein
MACCFGHSHHRLKTVYTSTGKVKGAPVTRGGDKTLPTGATPEQVPPPKTTPATADAAPGASAPVVIPASNPKIEKSNKEWDAINGSSPSGPVQTVTIKVDGKTVTLEIRVVGSKPEPGPGPGTGGDADLTKSLKDALASETGTVTAAVKQTGCRQLAGVYSNLASLVKAEGDHTIKGTLELRDKIMQSRKSAKQLTQTMKAIQEFLDRQFMDLNDTENLSPEGITKVSATFQKIADTLKGLP